MQVQDFADRFAGHDQGRTASSSPGSAVISSAVRPLLPRIAEAMNSVPGQILITGHTDNQPIRTLRYPSNWHLSQDRADAVKNELAKTVKPRAHCAPRARPTPRPWPTTPRRPAAPKTRRVELTLIVQQTAPHSTMKKILSIFISPLALALYGFLALAALVWWIGPADLDQRSTTRSTTKARAG